MTEATRERIIKTAKPILFNTPMTRAILDGRKTQTRRVIKINGYPITSPKESLELTKEGLIYHSSYSMSGYYKPLCQPGDILWVRETWATVSSGIIEYKATYIDPYTGSTEIDYIGKKITWRSPMFMPREEARIFLKVTNIRVERLQDITEEDAIAEGMSKTLVDGVVFISAKGNFHVFWDSLNIKRGYGWDTNPWVWVVEFERMSKGEALLKESEVEEDG